MTSFLKLSTLQIDHSFAHFLALSKSFLRSRLGFCAAIALLMVCLRLASFDYHAFFELQSIPNHDMYEGAPFFATNMHAIRLGGEIAWWNPISFHNGYAQYYQSFLSPLAPTPHHIVFILWAQFIYLLNLFNIQVPEYFQYLTVNYILLPFLSFFAFSLFTSLIFHYRTTVLFTLAIYTFSSIGIWYSAWFYFQESFSLFLLMAAVIGALQKPSIPALMLLLAAILIQVVSVNYWTVYNSWFFVVILVSYCWFQRSQPGQLLAYLRRLSKEHLSITKWLITLVGAVIFVWMLMIGSMVLEQSSNYIRSTVAEQGGYSISEAYLKMGRIDVSTQMFYPSAPLDQNYNAHFTRYLTTLLLPLLALVPLYRWGRREKWLMTSTVIIWIICLAPPFLLSLWKIFPFMDKIVHFFYFYTHFGQILLVLVAGLAMEKLFYAKLNAATKLKFTILAYCIGATGAILFLTHAFPHINPRISARVAVLTLFAGIVFLQVLWFGTSKSKKLFVSLFIVVCLADTTLYFREASLSDQRFTENRGWVGTAVPLASDIQAKLREPWSFSEPPKDFEVNLFDQMPVSNDFWPRNGYMTHRWLQARAQLPQDFLSNAVYGKGVEFYAPNKVILQSPETEDLTALPTYPNVLLLQSRRARKLLEDFQFSAPVNHENQFDYQWQDWKYNTFSFTVNSSQSGWLLIRQLYDPLWKLTVDGKSVQVVRANLYGMAFPISAGQSEIRMDYRPFARNPYWFASLLLELTLLVLLIISIRSSTLTPDPISNK